MLLTGLPADIFGAAAWTERISTTSRKAFRLRVPTVIGASILSSYIGAETLSFDRQMLHAESLSLLHPVTGTPLTFIAPPPPDMVEAIDRLR